MTTSLRGIAVNSDDNIYCTDGMSSQILKCDKNGGNIQIHDIEQEKGEGLESMVIVGEGVLACAAGVDGTILIFNRNLQFVKEIQHNGGQEFYDISADHQQNLYVADYTKKSIHVFSIDGTHLHSFNTDNHHGEERECGGEDDDEEEDKRECRD